VARSIPHLTEPARVVSPYGAGRVTPQRSLVAEVAGAWSRAFTVEELAAEVRTRDRAASVATVYRSVAALAENGWLERVGERDGAALFTRCAAGDRHHHHVVCDGCGRVEAAECPVAPAVSAGAAGAAGAAGGFVITRHEVTLYGLCPACADGTAS